jgi:hypothetical protein
MATILKRQVRANPHRTASEVWQFITNLIAPDSNSPSREELRRVGGIAALVIASEAPKDSPIVVHGTGPRLRVYCLYDEDAISGDGANENTLPFSAAEDDWHLSLPCSAEDLKWVQQELKKRSARVTAREIGDRVDEEPEATDERSAPQIDLKAFLRS